MKCFRILITLIAKKRSISDYKSMSKNELISAINTSEPAKNNRKNVFKSKRKEIKKSLMKPSKKKILKSKMKEIKKIVYGPILQSVTKIVRLAPPPPLFNVGCKFACSFLILAA